MSRSSAAVQYTPPANLISEPAPELRPPLKWAGGKRWLLPYLRPLWAKHADRRLVEPFCGGLAITLGLRPSIALLNDINPHLTNFYLWLRRGFSIDNPDAASERAYYAARARFNQLRDARQEKTPEAAALFYYLNRTGYNGLCRFNQNGGFNVPFGRYANITYTEDFRHYRKLLAGWTF